MTTGPVESKREIPPVANAAEHEWTQDEIDEDMFRADDPAECDCVHADYDLLEGRAHCPMCGRTWYLTGDQLRRELQFQAEQCELIEDEQEARSR